MPGKAGLLRIALPGLLCLALAACTLPRGAALQSEVLSGAGAAEADFAVYPVTRALLPELATWPGAGARPPHAWIPRQRGPAGQIIAPGDRVNLVVWDPEENSLLSTPGQKVVDLRASQVSPQGTIFAPYLGEIVVSNLTPDAARAHIQTYFEEIVPSAQVQIEHLPGRRHAVDLVGGVGSPGAVPLPDRDFTVMALLSQGGGVAPGLRNPQLRLVRDGRIFRTSLARLYDDPALDTTLRGGDKVFVEEDARRFLALGATGREELVPFPSDDVTALEAVSMIGGLSDNRANLKGILILREYPPGKVIPHPPGEAPRGGPGQARAVFVIDLTSADGLFSAGRFPIHAGDLVLATESPVTSVRTVFGLIGNVFGLARQFDNS